MIVRELELDLDAFEGPFDLLLTLVLKDELDLRDLDVAGIVLAFLERLAEVIRLLAKDPPAVSLQHMALRFPPVTLFLERFRAVLRRRRRFDFDAEVAGLSRVEQAVAFLALLELRRSNEIAIEQAAPFAPIRISRADVEREVSWTTVRSA